MSHKQVNYDQIAPTYDRRYTVNRFTGITATLLSLVQRCRAKRVLEVGCGTGRWLADLQPVVPLVYGLDRSLGMIRQACQRAVPMSLVCGLASQLPFPSAAFDCIFCVNALHHFARPQAFLAEARRLLRSDGALTIIGMDPHARRDRWYLYDYFEGTYEADLHRFPSKETLHDWMITAGFEKVEWQVAERIAHKFVGRAVLDDPTLHKNGTSQLAVLTEDAYVAGIERITEALVEAETAGNSREFLVDIFLSAVTGWVHEKN